MTRLGNYIVGDKLAEGGFGRIYVAEHALLGTKACLKQNSNVSKDDVELLKTEAKILWDLYEHHSIPTVRDFFKIDNENAAIALSYIEGKTLFDIVKEKGRLHPEDASWVTERVLGALYYAHFNGVIHSDVKPENVIVEPKKRDIKLIDWGLSVYRPTSRSIAVGSTPAYAAPELIDNKPPIPETDIYGAGLVFMFALGGDIAKKTLPSDIPSSIAGLVNQMTLYNPNERPNWESGLIQKLSDARQESFGRRHVI